MVVLGCGEKIESEDGQRIGFERGAIFFLYIGFYVLLGFREKKLEFLFFFLNDYRVLKKKNQIFCIFLK